MRLGKGDKLDSHGPGRATRDHEHGERLRPGYNGKGLDLWSLGGVPFFSPRR